MSPTNDSRNYNDYTKKNQTAKTNLYKKHTDSSKKKINFNRNSSTGSLHSDGQGDSMPYNITTK